MKRINFFLSALLALLCFGGTASANDVTALGLRFARSGTNAASVTVSVVDQNGTAVPGATATVETSQDFKPTGSNVTESILCPNVNGNTSPNIVMTFSISGLPAGFSFNNAALDIHALNGSGGYQQNNDNKTRQWNVAIKSGASAGALSDFASLDNIDIAAGIGVSGAVHQAWTAAAANAVTAGENLVIQLTITKGTANEGCFFGLSEIILSMGDAPEIPEPPVEVDGIDPTACYYIRWSQDQSLYMTENDGNGVIVAGQDNAQKQFWQFEATGNENCYYVKNVASGKYVQSCNMDNSNQSLITVGATPVEYYVPLCETATASVKGCYRLTSTDCSDYASSAASPHGLNKDGASTNVIVWMAGEGNTGSWWKLQKTEYLYDVRPFDFSADLSEARAIYAIVSPSTGKALEMAAEGTLSWAERTDADNQTWYFVGEGNCMNGGFMIANFATGLTINVEGEEQTKWSAIESGSAFVMRPYAKQDDATANLTIGEESAMVFKALRSRYSRASQIYAMPCGDLGNVFVAKAGISNAVKPMTYPLAVLSGEGVTQPSATKGSYWYSIYSRDKASVAPGQTFSLSLMLNQAPAAELSAWVYFDWNRDGVFDVSYPLTPSLSMSQEVSVPENAKLGESRMRVRLTTNGMEDADDCITAGQIIDFLINVVETPSAYACSVAVNDAARGTAYTHEVEAGSDERTVEARPYGDALFLCWKEANNVLSVESIYGFTLDHDTRLTAFFTPITVDLPTGIDLGALNEENFLLKVKADRGAFSVETPAEVRLVLVFTAEGELVGRSTTKDVTFATPLTAGTYIVKAFTANTDKVCKAFIK